jgi:hypothetical protein
MVHIRWCVGFKSRTSTLQLDKLGILSERRVGLTRGGGSDDKSHGRAKDRHFPTLIRAKHCSEIFSEDDAPLR